MGGKIILKRVFHRGKWRILISFKYDDNITAIVRQINCNRYSSTYKSWYADDSEETLKQILSVFRDKEDIDLSALTIEHENCVETGVETGLCVGGCLKSPLWNSLNHRAVSIQARQSERFLESSRTKFSSNC